MILKQLLFQLIQSSKLGRLTEFHLIFEYLTFTDFGILFVAYRVLNISEIRLKVSMAMSPGQRPRGVLGFWASLMTALGNTENMPVSMIGCFLIQILFSRYLSMVLQ